MKQEELKLNENLQEKPQEIDYDDIKTAQAVLSNFNFFLEIITLKNPNINQKILKKAFDFAKEAHKTKKRASGEPYFIHPIQVCLILIKHNIADTHTLCASLLHDVVEDTNYTIEDITTIFGSDIAIIVEGLTKINKDRFKEGQNFDFDSYNSENVRKMILAMAKNIRVIFVKIADRLNNMQTLDIFREEKKIRIAKQTLNVYAPLAEKLGLYKIKSELEDLCLLTLKPEIYSFLAKSIKLTKKQREEQTNELMVTFKELLSSKKINSKITGRAKHYYSIYKKMAKENKTIETIYDIYGIRIIVDTKEDCYAVLHMIQEKWNTQTDKRTGNLRLKDYIKNPKPNGYQSIHINFKYKGSVVEAQIRTQDMEHYAETGVAKHWRYKKDERDKRIDRKIDWIRQMISWIRDPKNKGLAETLTFDVFKDEIICITPKGDLVIIKEGSTPLDFAYAIHSKVGDHFERAYVNNEVALIDQKLSSGDIINIITSQRQMTSRHWLTFVKTNQAKTKIRQALGMTTSQKKVTKTIKENISTFNLEARIEVIGKKYPIKLSKCCNPQYGDDITGYLTKDKKTTIHKKTCPDRFALPLSSEVKVKWTKEPTTQIQMLIIAQDTPGTVTDILDILTKEQINIVHIESRERKKNVAIYITLKKEEIKKIENATKKIKEIQSVVDIHFDD